MMTLGSLFDGIAGFPLAGAMHGVTPVWASEIEPFPMAVSRERFPDMRQLGSVTEISGGEIEPVDIVTFGSPCQDLSVAGKQAGIHEGTRSSLFFEAVRIIKEMREATHEQYPRYAVWENVPGAFSSNKGQDFWAVLQAIVRIKDPSAAIPEPPKGKWSKAGCVVGDGYSLAWRTYDAQYWGVPQRRKRIYLVADFGGEGSGEILFERESLPGNPEQGGSPWEGAAEDHGRSADGGHRAGNVNHSEDENSTVIVFDTTQITSPRNKSNPTLAIFMAGAGAKAGSCSFSVTAAPTIKACASGLNQCPSIIYAIAGNAVDRETGQNGKGWCEHTSATINTQDRHAVVYPDIARTLTARYDSSPCADRGQNVVVYDARGNGDGKTAPTLTGDHQNRVTDYSAICIGNGQMRQVSYEEKTGALNCMYDQQAVVCPGKPPRRYIVRRLTPLECLRLQGYPDWWFDGVSGSDSAKYKACGNSLAIPCAADVIGRIARWGDRETD